MARGHGLLIFLRRCRRNSQSEGRLLISLGGLSRFPRGYPGHIRYVFNNGAPDCVIIQNTPVQWQQNSLLDNSFYLQDKWQIGRRLTLNLGFRFDRYTAFLPEQLRESAGDNIWASQGTDIVGLESFGNHRWDKQTVGTFNMPVPRLAFIYDLTGSGRTAIKASYGLFAWNPLRSR